MADDTLLLARDGAVATLTINRPGRRNALTLDMFTRIPGLVKEAAALPGVRALVLRGAGTDAFSAGADIGEFESVRATPEQTAAYDDVISAAEDALESFPGPVIAAIKGFCYGGGCNLALACDIRYADPGARLAITPAKLGVVYPLRSTKRLVDLVGPSRAKLILMTGSELDAARAASLGLVDEVAADLDAAVGSLTALLATRSPVTQRAAKETVHRVLSGVTREDAAHAALRDAALASPDYREGVRAFLERRPPVFTD